MMNQLLLMSNPTIKYTTIILLLVVGVIILSYTNATPSDSTIPTISNVGSSDIDIIHQTVISNAEQISLNQEGLVQVKSDIKNIRETLAKLEDR